MTLDPGWFDAVWRFVQLGCRHILSGADHLLFLLCVVAPFPRVRPLVALVTSFTVAHSITLLATAVDLAPSALWFPPLIETAIALSIVYLACENIVGSTLRRRWLTTFAFGLIHGFGFSFVLRETLQFSGSHVITSLLAFNLGVELGQLLVLLVMAPILVLAFRKIDARIGVIVLSALIAHGGWHWMTDRGAGLLAYDFRWPSPDVTLLIGGMRWAMVVLVTLVLAWILRRVFACWLSQD